METRRSSRDELGAHLGAELDPERLEGLLIALPVGRSRRWVYRDKRANG